MRVTLLGHATLLVESDGCRALVDPVLFDPHQEGLFHVAPAREVRLEALPPLDLVALSHRHMDHFDVRSLSHLPRGVRVAIPEDDLVERVLRRLGFVDVRRVRDFEAFTVGGTVVLPTKSELKIPEHGFVFRDGSGTVWDQVDTVLSEETIARVRALVGPIDLMIAAWQPLLENDFQVSGDHGFPLARYRTMMEAVRRAAPRWVVPGSCGFAYVGSASWMNHVVFPVTRERYCDDLASLVPDLEGRVVPLDPGDTLRIEGGEVRREEPSPLVVRLEGGPSPYEFRPVDAPRPAHDDNPDGRSEEELELLVMRELTADLPAFVASSPEAFALHRAWAVRHQIEVVFPSFRRRWSYRYDAGAVEASPEDDPRANLFTVVTASALAGLIEGTRGWDWAYLRGSYRTNRKLYRAGPLGLDDEGAVAVKDPLRVRFPLRQVTERVVERELERWSSASRTLA